MGAGPWHEVGSGPTMQCVGLTVISVRGCWGLSLWPGTMPENGATKGGQFLKVRCSKVTTQADIVHREWRVVCDMCDVLSDVQMQRSTQDMKGQAGWV